MVGSFSYVTHYFLNTTEVLRGLFAVYGLPEELVSDIGPQIVSK